MEALGSPCEVGVRVRQLPQPALPVSRLPTAELLSGLGYCVFIRNLQYFFLVLLINYCCHGSLGSRGSLGRIDRIRGDFSLKS